LIATSVVAETSPPTSELSPLFIEFCTASDSTEQDKVERGELSHLALARDRRK
jgi:hypothetical protein